MKIAHLITGLGMGGAEKMLLKTIPRLKNKNFIISLTNNDTLGKRIEEAGIKVYYLGLKKSNLLSTILKFRKIIKKEKPDILNSYLIHSNLFGRIFGKLFGVKKIICSVRNKHINKHFLNFLDRRTSFLVDLYTPNSNALVPFLIKHQKIKKAKIRVIENGIELDKFNFKIDEKKKKKELGLKKQFIIGCIAKLEKQKGYLTLIRAAKELNNPNMLFLFIGDGKERQKLENFSKNLGVQDQIKFLGWRKDTKELLKITDLFVLPSFHEGMSNSLLEAMASKVCCLVSNIDENKELIKNEENGLTFRTGNYKNLAEKIKFLYNNKNLREKYREKAYETAKKRFDIKKTVEKYTEVVESVWNSWI